MDNSEQSIKQVSEDTEAETEAITAQAEQWQRLSPIAILYFGITFITQMSANFVYMAPGFIVFFEKIKNNLFIAIPILLTLLSLMVLAAYLSYHFYQYRIREQSIEIRSGVFAKKHINLPFERIQNVKIEQPIYYRFHDYACLQLDTAGSSKQEAKVVAMPLLMANELKLRILSRTSDVKNTDSDTGSESDTNSQARSALDETVLNTRSLSDLVVHGITSNRVWIFLGLLAPFYERLSAAGSQLLLRFGVDLKQIFSVAEHSWWQLGLYAFALTAFVMMLLAVFSILGAILTFYGYTLSRQEDRYIRRSGLLTKHEVSIKRSRIQVIVRKQDWLDGLLNRINLKFEQVSDNFQNMAQGGQLGATSNKIIVPSIYPHESSGLIKDAFPDNQLDNATFSRISQYFLIKNIGLILAPLTLIAAGFLIYIEDYMLLVAVLGLSTLMGGLIALRWYRWGYAQHESFLYIRKGLMGVDYYCFPIYKLQQVKYCQSIFMRKRNLANIKLVLASGELGIPFMETSVALSVLNYSIRHVEENPQSWM